MRTTEGKWLVPEVSAAQRIFPSGISGWFGAAAFCGGITGAQGCRYPPARLTSPAGDGEGGAVREAEITEHRKKTKVGGRCRWCWNAAAAEV
jgi:hypothetical protein